MLPKANLFAELNSLISFILIIRDNFIFIVIFLQLYLQRKSQYLQEYLVFYSFPSIFLHFNKYYSFLGKRFIINNDADHF